MEEVVVEETQTVQSAAGLYTGCSTLTVTPDVLGLFSYIFLMISGLFFLGWFVAGGKIHHSTTESCCAETDVV